MMDLVAVLVALTVVAARMLPLVELMPVLSGPWVPRTVRLAVALGLTLLVAPTAIPPALLAPPALGLLDVVGMVVRELLVGIALGFASSLVFEAARMAGAMVDRQAALHGEDGPVSRLYLLVAVVLFFGLGGGKLWIYAIAQSYVALPLSGGAHLADGLIVARMVADAISVAVLLALPVLTVVLVAELCLAVSARMSRVLAGAVPSSSRTLVAVAAVALSLGVFVGELGAHLQASLQALPSAIESIYVQ